MIIGQHTTVNFRYVGKNFLMFQVVFYPGALFRLAGIPQHELENEYLDAQCILGHSINKTCDLLQQATHTSQMVDAVDRYLVNLFAKTKIDTHIIDSVATNMVLKPATFHLNRFLNDACLSHRQFDRKFKERIGIPPKQYLRIARLNDALRFKNTKPTCDWLTVALQSHYYDYQHLSKDFKELTGFSPVQFEQLDQHAPERFFGERCR